MEILDIRYPDGTRTGETKDRTMVHRDGDLHATAHVWIVKKREDGGWDVLLQKRAAGKDAFPGCYDISSAGHIPAGQDYEESALREMEEELGIPASGQDLEMIGTHEGYYEGVFHGAVFRNHEVSRVYVYRKEIEISDLILQEEEVESVRWMDLEECIRRIREQEEGYCLPIRELVMLEEHLNKKEE